MKGTLMSVALPMRGDVLVVRTPGLFARIIRFGAWLQKAPQYNHCAVLSHQDKNGVWWCIEGKPSSVGYTVATKYLSDPFTISNERLWYLGTPATDAVRQQIVDLAAEMIGKPYAWDEIIRDAMHDLGGDDIWKPDAAGSVPCQFVCSSLAAWLYDHFGLLAPPGPAAAVQPFDWAQYILSHPE